MKNYYYLLIILFVSCSSGDDKKGESLKEVAVVEAFSMSKENSKVKGLNSEKIIIKRNGDNALKQLIIYENGSIQSYTEKNIINEGEVYVIITDADIKVLNTSSKRNDINLFKIIKHYAGLNSRLGAKVKNMYLSESCTASGTDMEGTEKTQTFKFDKFLEPNIKQLIVDTDDGIFIYKIDLQNEPVVYVEMEPIYKLSVKNWYSFSDKPIEKVFLDETKKFIETRETEFTDHSHSLKDTSLEWKSNNKKQVFTLNKISLIQKIQDEI